MVRPKTKATEEARRWLWTHRLGCHRERSCDDFSRVELIYPPSWLQGYGVLDGNAWRPSGSIVHADRIGIGNSSSNTGTEKIAG